MFWFFGIIAALLSAAAGLYWRWKRNIDADIAEGAAIEWERLNENEPEFLKGLSEEKFREIYARVHTPRFPGYALATIATFFISLPFTFALLAGLLLGAQAAGVIPEPVEVVEQLNLEGGDIKLLGKDIDQQTRLEMAYYYIGDLAGFYYFFGVIVVWLLIVWFFMRRYHARRPGYLRDEIIRARG